MPDNAELPPSHRGSLAAMAIALPLLYVLSIGPVFWLREHGYIVRGSGIERTLVACYGPIEVLLQIVPPLKPLLRSYIELFTSV